MEMLDTREDIERLVEKPAEFVESLGTAAGPAGKKFALAKARPRITKALEQYAPLTFEDVLPVFETIDTLAEVQEALKNPEGHFQNVLAAGGRAGKKFALAQARPRITKALAQSGLSPPLTFEDVLPMSGGEKAGSRGWWVRSVPTGEGWRCRVGGRSCAARG